MNKYAAYTVITGGYDFVREIKHKDPEVDYFLFTNSDITSDTYQVIRIESELDHRTLSRDVKINCHKYLSFYERSLYIDGNVRIIGSVKEFLDSMTNDLATFCINKTVRQEARLEARWATNHFGGNRRQIMKKLLDYNYDFTRSGSRKTMSLYGKVLLRKHTKRVATFNDIWWNTFVDMGIGRDQLALTHAAHQCSDIFCELPRQANEQSRGPKIRRIYKKYLSDGRAKTHNPLAS